MRWLLLAALAACDPVKPVNKTPPEDAARDWATKLGLPYRGAACTTVDSDGDGYVSCVLSLGADGGLMTFQNLQCAELSSNRAGGCKPDSKNPAVNIVNIPGFTQNTGTPIPQ